MSQANACQSSIFFTLLLSNIWSSLPQIFTGEKKKKINQDRNCCCSSPAVALLCCPALISFQSGTALPLLIHQGLLQSLRLAYSCVPAFLCPRRCLVGTGVCSIFQQDCHQTSLSRTDKLPPVFNTQSCTVSTADLCCTSACPRCAAAVLTAPVCALSQHLRAAVSGAAIPGQPFQIVSQGWPRGAGLMDVLVRALQLMAAAHPSLCFLYP